MGNVNCLRCRFRHEDNGNCTAVGGFCTAVAAAHCPLLREYLDTELTPKEAKRMSNILLDVGIDYNCSREYVKNWLLDDRLRELAEADRAGRLAVLPCKVGDTVYVINRHLGKIFANTVISISVGNSTDLKNYIRTKWVGEKGNESIRKWTLRQVGRYVFLTHEEAEAALEAIKDE